MARPAKRRPAGGPPFWPKGLLSARSQKRQPPVEEGGGDSFEEVLGNVASEAAAALGQAVSMTALPRPVAAGGADSEAAVARELLHHPVWTGGLLLPPEHLLVLHLPLGLPVVSGVLMATIRTIKAMRRRRA